MTFHTSHRPGPRLLRSLLLAACATAAQVGAARPALATASNVVYVETNDPTPGRNAVLGYRRASDGSLTPLPGSPFYTDGTGVANPAQILGPDDSDQILAVSPDHRFLFAVNSGSETIAVLRIRDNGALVPVAGSPFPSGGINPVSVGVAGDLLVVVNKDGDPAIPPTIEPPNYTVFRIRPSGYLSPAPHSTISVPVGSSPSQALISPDGVFVFGADFLAGKLRSFRLLANGRLIQAPGSPQSLPSSVPPPALALGLAANPYLPIVYAGFTTASELGVYLYDDDGSLYFVGASSDSGFAPCWSLVSPDGATLYEINTGDNSVSRYDLSDPFAPVETQHFLTAGPGNLFQEALDPTGTLLYVVSQRTTADPSDTTGNGLHILQIDQNGVLSEAPFSPMALPIPPAARAEGVVVL